LSEEVEEGMFTAVGDPENPDLEEPKSRKRNKPPLLKKGNLPFRYRIPQKDGL
jgi:hypothetical protein